MKFLLVFSLFVISHSAFAQKRIDLSLNVGSNYNNRFYKFENNPENDELNEYINNWNHVQDSIEKPLYSYQVGFEVGFQLYKGINIITGFSIKRLGTESQYKKYESYEFMGHELIRYDSKYSSDKEFIHYYSFPVKVKYFFLNKPFNIGLMAGINYNRLLNYEQATVDDIKHSRRYNIYPSDHNFSLAGGVEFSYQIYDKLCLGLDFQYNRSITPSIKIKGTSDMMFLQQIQEYYYHFELNLKTTYRLEITNKASK